MKFTCTMTATPDGRWRADCSDAELGRVSATGDSQDEAVRKLEDELRYRLELCPCSGESYRHIEVEIESS